MASGAASRPARGASQLGLVVARAAAISRVGLGHRYHHRLVGFAADLYSTSVFFANWLGYFVGLPQHCGLRDHTQRLPQKHALDEAQSALRFLCTGGWVGISSIICLPACLATTWRRLHKEVAHDMPEPRTLIGAWKEMRETWRRQKIDPDYQFDTPLPADGKAGARRRARPAAGRVHRRVGAGGIARAGLSNGCLSRYR